MHKCGILQRKDTKKAKKGFSNINKGSEGKKLNLIFALSPTLFVVVFSLFTKLDFSISKALTLNAHFPEYFFSIC